MNFATLRRWLWLAYLFWTALAFVVLPFDLGESQIKAWVTQPEWQSLFLGILRAADAVWVVLAAANIYFHLIQQEGIKTARRVTGWIIFGTSAVLALGVHTGLPFGPFIFTNHLGAKIMGVPFAVPLLWLVVIVSSRYAVVHFWEHAQRWQMALTTGALVTMTDLSLEWIAWKIRACWLWYFPLANTPPYPPVQNFVMWFLLATLLTWLAFPAVRPVGRQSKPVLMLALTNLLFWLTIAVRHLR